MCKYAKIGNYFFKFIVSLVIFFGLAYFLTVSKFFDNEIVKNYIVVVKDILQILLLFILISILVYVVLGFLGKKYSLKIDKFNIGGINILFDKSSDIYIKTVGTFICSKRSLFSFDDKRDNIYEVLNTYYAVQKVIKDNIELIDSEKDKSLYNTSIEIIKMLNVFLTKHQNDYRRWYDYIITSDHISSEYNSVHETTIKDVQVQYYRYYELYKDIVTLNTCMLAKKKKSFLNDFSFEWECK